MNTLTLQATFCGLLHGLGKLAFRADKTAADLKAAGIISFTEPEKKVLPNTFGGLQNWFFTGPSGEQIELLQML